MSQYTQNWDSRHLATYRTLLKRALRRATKYVANEALTPDLEVMVIELTKHAPKVTASALEDRYREAARAWERGNNSGDSERLEREEITCELFRDSADAVLFLFGIATDFPGLYPSFTWQGHGYNSAESVLSAWAEWEKFQEVGK